MAGPFAISNADGNRTIDPLSEAPASDTGQVALPVRVISQLGAGTGGGSSGGLTNTELRASPVPVSGSVAVNNLPATQAVSGTVAVNNFPATQPVSGSVGVTNWPASQPVTGAFYQATQPVSGPLTDTQLRAAAVPVNVGNFPASQPVTGMFWQATQPVSGTFWQATQPVSGTTTANQGTANATPWNDNVAQWGGSATTLGQKAMTASVPVVIASDQTVISTKAVQAVTYTAIYRLAARPYALSNAFAAAGRKQYATIHHAATAVKLVKVKRVEVALESTSVAAIVMADLVRITAAPATPNPAVTATPQFPGDAAAETTCMCLPTTAGTEGAIHSFLEWNLGITGAASVLNPPPALNWYTLWPQVQGAGEVPENKYPTMRAGTLEGFAVTLDCNAIGTVKGYVVIEFSEE